MNKIVEKFVKKNVFEHDISFEINIPTNLKPCGALKMNLKTYLKLYVDGNYPEKNESVAKFGFEISLKKRI